MGSGAGRGRKGGPTGRRHFSTIEEMKSGTSSEPKWKQRRNRDQEDDPEEEGEEGSSEEESEEEEEEKHKGVAGLIAVENPNAPRKAAVKVSQADTSAPTTQLSRREREEIEKERSKERYMKLQEQGKTEQSKKDLERLALIRQQREEAAKKKEEERLAKEAKKLEARKR
ncbi:hypothetical protein CLOM_g4115 [Closterium sp. NIES-68]|nr:hypothetical protein CLOM_g4115 [Closterium sp. NIES-68]GJP62925.1 hypothetical protein CLOP_g19988 [Closterium sp. NIES-67]